MKRFNTTGVCLSSQHYMVDLTERVREIRKMVDQGDYFCINRGRQFGKTTTLNTLKDALQDDYTVFSISFESIGDETFEKEELLAKAFLNQLNENIDFGLVSNASEKFTSLLSEILA